MYLLYFLLTGICYSVFKVDSCTFPINGTWLTSDRGTLTFTNTTVSNFVTTDYGTLTFTCDDNDGEKYMARSTQFLSFNIYFRVYICLQLTEVSENKYIYYSGTEKNVNASEDRIKVITSSTVVNVSYVCDRTEFEEGTYGLMIKDGYAENETITCPSEILASWSYTYETTSGGTLCGSSSSLDVCSDNTTLMFDYTQCSQQIMYSDGGNLSCIYSNTSASGSHRYLHVYNTDTTTDETTTYRFTCLVMTSSGDNLVLTQSPQNCVNDQNSSSIESPGASLVFTLSSQCYTTEAAAAETEDYTVIIVLGVLIPLLAIATAILLIFLLWIKHEKKVLNTKPKPDPKFEFGEIRNRRLNKHDGVIHLPLDTIEMVDDSTSEVSSGIRRDASIVVNLPSSSRNMYESSDDQTVITDSEVDHVTESEGGSDDEDSTELITPRILEVPKMETISEGVNETESNVGKIDDEEEDVKEEQVDETDNKAPIKVKKKKRPRKKKTPRQKVKRRKKGSVGDSFLLKKKKDADSPRPVTASKEKDSHKLHDHLSSNEKITVGTSTLILKIKPKKRKTPRTQKKTPDNPESKDTVTDDEGQTSKNRKNPPRETLSQILSKSEEDKLQAKQQKRKTSIHYPLDVRRHSSNGDIKFNFFHRFAELRKKAIQEELKEEEREKEANNWRDENENQVGEVKEST